MTGGDSDISLLDDWITGCDSDISLLDAWITGCDDAEIGDVVTEEMLR